jgi:hypothetical protein
VLDLGLPALFQGQQGLSDLRPADMNPPALVFPHGNDIDAHADQFGQVDLRDAQPSAEALDHPSRNADIFSLIICRCLQAWGAGRKLRQSPVLTLHHFDPALLFGKGLSERCACFAQPSQSTGYLLAGQPLDFAFKQFGKVRHGNPLSRYADFYIAKLLFAFLFEYIGLI